MDASGGPRNPSQQGGSNADEMSSPLKLGQENRFALVHPPLLNREARSLARIPSRPLRLPGLPVDVLSLFMDKLLPPWALDASAHGPRWVVADLTAPLGIDMALAIGSFYSLALVSRRMNDIATPYLYRIVHSRDVSTMLSLWLSLAHLRPSNATHIRHLLVGQDLDNRTDLLHAQSWIVDQRPPIVDLTGYSSAEPCLSPIRWISGQQLLRDELYIERPSITHKVCFDILTRAVHLRSLAVKAPTPADPYASSLFRQSLALSVSPGTFTGAAHLQRLCNITLQVEGNFQAHLSVYGMMTLPQLKRLILASEGECWALDMYPHAEFASKTILQKAMSLTITWGCGSPRMHAEFALRLWEMPRLESIAIHPPPIVLGTDGLTVHMSPTTSDISRSLQAAGHLKILDLRWILHSQSQAWRYLGTPRRLDCLSSLQNLVILKVSTQLLFGSLSRLEVRLQLPAEAGESVAELVRCLPDSLQKIAIVEWWPETELAGYDPTEEDEDEDEDEEEEEEDEDEDAFGRLERPEHMIQASEDKAILGLTRLLCKTWLVRRREARVVELRPQNALFYGAYTHEVLLGTEGLEMLLTQTIPVRSVYRYSFAPVVFVRGVESGTERLQI